MLYLTCTTITSVDLAHYGVSRAKDWVSVDCGTNNIYKKKKKTYEKIKKSPNNQKLKQKKNKKKTKKKKKQLHKERKRKSKKVFRLLVYFISHATF